MYGAIFVAIVAINITLIISCWCCIQKCQSNDKYGKQGYSKPKVFDSESHDDATEAEEFEEFDVENEPSNDK